MNELAMNYQSQNPQVNQIASQGRGSDSMMAHVTPGDYVIPKDILVDHPEFLVKLKKVMEDAGGDYRSHMVGSGFENINPNTGAPEFKFGNFLRSVGRVALTIPTVGASEIGGSNSLGAGLLGGGSTAQNLNTAINLGKNTGPLVPSQPTPAYSPTEMKLPGSLQELGGLTDLQRRSYLASQGAQGEGLGGSSRDYYINLLQRNIQNNQNANLLPVESQYLSQGGVNTNLSGQDLINALRNF